MERKVELIYVGNGNYINGVPAKDITVSEEEAQALIKTKLYKIGSRKKPVSQKEAKE